jgi:uncharacterized protein YndB with AHSA1/START domain
MKKNEKPIIIEETFERGLQYVWNAITDVDQMRKWFFENIPDFKPVVGFEVEFNIDAGERTFLHLWKITRVVPLKLIEYNWRYGGYPGDSYVTFLIERENDLTKLKLTHVVSKDFPDEVPEFTRDSCISGWKYFINQRLKQYLS